MVVDFHCHVVPAEMTTAAVPERWRPRLNRGDDGRTEVGLRGTVIRSIVGEFTDPGLMLAQAASQGVDHLILSPWVSLIPVDADLGEASAVCEVQNDGLAALAASHQGRISVLAALPLQDADAAAQTLRAAMARPGVVGAEIPASVQGTYLGDPVFGPIWAAAEEAGALMFVHPTTTGFGLEALRSHYLWNSVGNPLETAVTAAQMAAAGVLDRHPGLAILLAHGGGALPAVRGRLRRAYGVRPEASADSPAGPDEILRRFYYDSLTHELALLRELIEFAGVTQVVLGSDRPFDMGSERAVDEVRALGDSGLEQLILSGNATRLGIAV